MLCTLFIREILKSVAQSLFTLTINEYTTANVYLYLCFQLRMMYMKYTFSNELLRLILLSITNLN